jgi:hypothetical protein
MRRILTFALALCCCTLPALAAPESARYVGADACEPCHSEQYESFKANSSKAHSWDSVKKMLPKLTRDEARDCYACHTTGYAKGGFESFEKTPQLANLSCEACHGPGSLHAESADTDDIRRTPDVKSCTACHNADRVQNFKFKPMLYHGGH